MRGLLLLVSMIAAPAFAAADDTIIVTGHALTQPPGTAAYGVQVIDGTALAAAASGRLESVLESAAGFQLFRRTDSRSANPTSQGTTLRGIGGNAASRALVLLDGVPVADPFAGWIAWPSIRPESLGLVRVTTGGGAGAFGAGAVSGVIELESVGAARRNLIRADYGSRDSVSTYAGGTLRLGNGFVGFDAGYDRGDGFRLLRDENRGPVDIPAAYEQYGGAIRVVVPLAATAELQLRTAAFTDDRTRGIAIVDSSNSGVDASIRAVSRGALPWEALAYVQTRDFSARFARLGSGRALAIPTLDQFAVPATGVGAKGELRPSFGAHSIRIGADWRHSSGSTKENFSFVSGAFTRSREAGGNAVVYGVFVEDDWQITGNFLLAGGIRLDRWSLTGGRFEERAIGGGSAAGTDFVARSGTEPTARIGTALDITPAMKLRAAGYLGFRVPTLNELYRPFRVGADATAANAALRPERMRGVEAGVDFQPLSTAHASFTGFFNRAENAVGNVTLGRGPGVFPGVGFVAGTFRQRLNLDAIEAFGIEARASLDLGRWSLASAYAFTDSMVKASGIAAALDGRRPAQVPRHQATATASYSAGGRSASLTLRYDGARFEDDLEALRLASALTVDAVVRVPVARDLTLRLAAENVFDAEIAAGRSDDGTVDRGQPRTLWIGIGWTPGA